ncbi:hypothetical protein TH66_13885 [Carbonactinospora thermoautotrophica]|uniref:DNA-(apurinic or apyrimidinic site) lyase n=2 Tax=Carbonactinospora thermoautotrophica TaxID=1469144 RepID=A0A132MW00_9ACTN|nr:DNA-formamidopyrimidine glycosylase family protein [Carbonactinospora thermoautotrophica]KWX00046.1 hypothetical protein TH66_13885 [Carbonactinospora thermoautotrophica]KWX02039.1 Formamidopyrimidine-DNA glycosylase [Carbonactinospora thermoautotrophica]
MPEGHTIHRLARDLGALFGGRPVRAASPQGRFAAGAAAIDGSVLQAAEAYGKHLLLGFGDGAADEWSWVHVHLGLAGRFTFGRLPAPPAPPVVRLRLTDARGYADLRGPAVCQLLAPGEKAALTGRLGPDPLRPDFDPERVWERIRRSRRPIAALLLDQRVIAGVGNVYRAEVLFRQRVHPYRPGASLTRAEWQAICADLVALMRLGVEAGRIITTDPEHRERRPRGPDGVECACRHTRVTTRTLDAKAESRARAGKRAVDGPARAESFYLYERAGLPCRLCGTPVRAEPFQGRTLYWCPACQAA